MKSLEKDVDKLQINVQTQADNFSVDLKKYLEGLKTPYSLAQWIVSYDAFNRGFPGAGLQLAGRIGLHANLFGDLAAEQISAKVLAAISDEFIHGVSKKTSLHSVTRRAFAKNAIKNLAEQFQDGTMLKDLSDVEIDKVFTDPAVAELRQRVINSTIYGYGIEEKDDLRGVFSGLGFFTGSETSGSVEFKVLGDYLDERWPGLIESLRGVEDGQGKQVYDWVVAHQDLESDHAKFAFSAVKDAIENLATEYDVKTAILEVRAGFNKFFQSARGLLLKDGLSSVSVNNLFDVSYR